MVHCELDEVLIAAGHHFYPKIGHDVGIEPLIMVDHSLSEFFELLLGVILVDAVGRSMRLGISEAA